MRSEAEVCVLLYPSELSDVKRSLEGLVKKCVNTASIDWGVIHNVTILYYICESIRTTGFVLYRIGIDIEHYRFEPNDIVDVNLKAVDGIWVGTVNGIPVDISCYYRTTKKPTRNVSRIVRGKVEATSVRYDRYQLVVSEAPL